MKIKHFGISIGFLLCFTLSFADTSFAVREATINALNKKYECLQYTMDSHKNILCPIKHKFLLLPKNLNASEDVWQKQTREAEAAFIEWLEWEARLRNKIKPKIGMSSDYIYRHVMGPPDSINETETASGKTMQWIYEEGNQRISLYTSL